MRIEQPRHRQIDAADLVEIDRVVERGQPGDLVGGQRQRRVGAELGPALRREEPVWRVAICRNELVHRAALPLLAYRFEREAFSAVPDWVVRRSSSAMTPASGTPEIASTTSQW